ncbi:EpsD family peptidyl-prolyl cis-trans isomerase [Paludibacterium paludis]|uniref:peptidylprolyl isomerase n=1 Tax=Paludibacterium paludis TaxID=1225769 RepID=A0A918P3Q9_9NEIS|nr:EpsD family peptidyl-prolyl cis-trans isomerase [Paludibacterium paludis]GGY19238.1 hypothetical protein GCM10011289_23420 [Paludibacterium paludis]
MLTKKSTLCLVAVAVTVALAGCSKKEEKKTPSQVLARVNGAEITLLQLNSLVGNLAPGQAGPAVQQQALDQLVNQELLVQKAGELKLDRDPTVLQAIEMARRDILARAASEKLLGGGKAPSQAEISDFYAKNPALFSGRRIYDVVAFIVPTAELKDSTRAALDSVKTPDETRTVLENAKVRFDARPSRIPAEKFPLPLLPKIADMKQGDIIVVPEGERTTLMQLVRSEAAPVQLDKVQDQIKTYLAGSQMQDTAKTKLDELKKAAKIEYVKRFASEPAAGAAPAAAPAEPAAKGAVDQDALKSGVKGL